MVIEQLGGVKAPWQATPEANERPRGMATQVVDAEKVLHANAVAAASASAEQDATRNDRQDRQREGEPMALADLASHLNQQMKMIRREIQFDVDRDSGQLLVQVVDRESKEGLRQIPSEEALQLSQRLDEMTGLIFNKHV
jgi:flagellar protein FlaG